jgi:hypothetical protein
VALRKPLTCWDDPHSGKRYRAGLVVEIVDGKAVLEVMVEPNHCLRFRGPAASWSARQPIYALLADGPEYQLAAVYPGQWGSTGDAYRAQASEGGVHGIIPFELQYEADVISQQKDKTLRAVDRDPRVLWRGSATDQVTAVKPFQFLF